MSGSCPPYSVLALGGLIGVAVWFFVSGAAWLDDTFGQAAAPLKLLAVTAWLLVALLYGLLAVWCAW